MKIKNLFIGFIASFEVECETDFKEELKKLSDIVDVVREFYEKSQFMISNH